MKIGADLDGVLGHVSDELNKRIEKQFGVELSNIHLIGYDKFFEDNDLDTKWLQKQWNDEWLWSRAIPDTENIEALKYWQSRGHEIHIITGRSQKETAMVTRAWLRKHGIPIENLAFEPIMYKLDYLKARDIPVMFEDMFFEANKIASYGIPCYVLRRTYNSQFELRITNPLVKFIDSLWDADGFIKEREFVG
jgi:uncharacterized HAD superfamily protein